MTPIASPTRSGPTPRWWRAADDSLVALISQDGRRPASIWFPVVNLVWLVWMIAAPWMFPHPDATLVVLTYASVAVFLVLYQRAWFGSRSRVAFCTTMIALLGLAIIPVNSSWSYVIYAGSLIPFCARGRRAAGWVAVLLAAFWAVASASGFFTFLPLISCILTTAIVALLNGVYRNNLERDGELRLTQDEVRRLAVTAERERIGRDLHDLLGHTLSLIAIKSELARRIVIEDPETARNELIDIERVARQALAEVREAVTGIRAAAMAGELASARLMLESGNIGFEFAGSYAALHPAAESALALGLREAVTNVYRHAQATRVEVVLATADGMAELSVHDNGRGGIKVRGNGLAGMEERLTGVGGQLALTSTVGRGTIVRMRVPSGGADGAPRMSPGAS